jgi:hypothetical protein
MLWSTAQARYGRALRVSGVQYPPPPLTVNVDHKPTRPPLPPLPPAQDIIAVADLAQTVYNGVSLTNPFSPQTEIWFLLYAQVQRVDGQAWRNVLLAKKPGTLLSRIRNPNSPPQGQRTDIPVAAIFPQSEVVALLAKLGLPPNTPTSVLAVELFNGEANVTPESSFNAAPQASVQQQDPLGAELGARRVLRVSPLTAVRAVC